VVQESENEAILEEDKQEDKNSKINSSPFDTIEVDLGDEEEIIIIYTRSGRIIR
jgi:hypothetical protein